MIRRGTTIYLQSLNLIGVSHLLMFPCKHGQLEHVTYWWNQFLACETVQVLRLPESIHLVPGIIQANHYLNHLVMPSIVVVVM